MGEPSSYSKQKLGILASGSGTNMEAIAVAVSGGDIPAEVAVVVCDNPGAYVLIRARRLDIPTETILLEDFPDRSGYDTALAGILEHYEVDLVVLAGYMKLVGPEVLEKYGGRIINIHPALLPSFPGTHGVRDALDYGVRVTGVTVHFVDQGLDTGPVILQESVSVEEGDDEETLHNRIHRVEYRLFPEAIRLFCEDRLRIEGRKVLILPEPGD